MDAEAMSNSMLTYVVSEAREAGPAGFDQWLKWVATLDEHNDRHKVVKMLSLLGISVVMMGLGLDNLQNN